jgi:hypothetical protein
MFDEDHEAILKQLSTTIHRAANAARAELQER